MNDQIDSPRQLFFDLDFPDKQEAERLRRTADDRKSLRRAVLRWLRQAEPPPTGMAADVVTRISRYRADVAAFWSRSRRNPHASGPRKLLIPAKTVIVQCHVEREECWPDCARAMELLPELKALRNRLREIEARIREREPYLRDDASLFEDFADWRYDETKDREWHRVRRQIEKCEHALYHGTKFERIRSASLADALYVAVPAGVIRPEELADGWGLLWIDDKLRVEEISPPVFRDCLPEYRMHLVQNIAAAAMDAVLKINGIRSRSVTGGEPGEKRREWYFTRLPRLPKRPRFE